MNDLIGPNIFRVLTNINMIRRIINSVRKQCNVTIFAPSPFLLNFSSHRSFMDRNVSRCEYENKWLQSVLLVCGRTSDNTSFNTSRQTEQNTSDLFIVAATSQMSVIFHAVSRRLRIKRNQLISIFATHNLFISSPVQCNAISNLPT